MIPLRDNIPSRSTPFVNYTIIALTALVFFFQLGEEPGESQLVEQYGMIPARVTNPGEPVQVMDLEPVRTPRGIAYRKVERPAMEAAVPAWLTLFTCIFLHGGWLHFLGNMWFLFIFGDNVEDRFGHTGFVIFYLLTGAAASLSHLVSAPGSSVPTIGASGAIAGVMGAYMYLYPHAKVLTLVPIFIFIQIIVLPAPIYLGIWFAIQFFQGAFAITAEATGVAWWAHIGGFAVGLIAAWGLWQFHLLRPPVQEVLPGTDHVRGYRYHRRH